MKNITFILLILFIHISAQAQRTDEHYPEKLHLHLQKNILVAGEPLWFKAYCINLKNNKLSKRSNVAYIEFVNKEGIPITKESIILNNGLGKGALIINKQLPTGQYAINAYTHWSNSISENLITSLPVYVFNNETVETNKQTNSSTKNITTLKTNEWSPIQSEDKDLSINVNAKLEDLERIIHIELTHQDTSLIASNEYHLSLVSDTGIEKAIDFRFVYGKWDTHLKISDLKSDIYYFLIENEKKEKVYENTLSIRKRWENTPIHEARISSAKRQKNKIQFKLSDLTTSSDSLFLSASVRKKEPVISSFNMINFLNFHKNFNGHSGNMSKDTWTNSIWFGSSSVLPVWSQATMRNKEDQNRYFEQGKYILEGKVVNKESKLPLKNQEVYLSKIGEFVDMEPTITNNNGQFYFSLPLKSGLHDISIQLPNKDTVEYDFVLKEKFNKKGVLNTDNSFSINNESNLSFVKTQWENFKIRELYDQTTYSPSGDSLLHRAETNFFGQAKIKMVIDDYVRLDSLAEYFHELISHVKIKRRKKQTVLNVFNYDQLRLMDQKPLLLYDGMIMSNPSKILSKDSRSIDRVEVVPYEYFYKNSHFYGIVHVISKNKNCEVASLPANTERYYLPLFISECKQKEYQMPSEHVPDFRTDLLWEPNIIISKEKGIDLEFTTGDVTGEYELIIEGISEKGEPIVLTQDIIVE